MALEEWEREGGDSKERPRTHFRLGTVFDRAQVAPLPPPATSAQLDPPLQAVRGDELAPALLRLIDLANEIGSEGAVQGAGGRAQRLLRLETRVIAVREEVAGNMRVKTLAHELAHALLAGGAARGGSAEGRSSRLSGGSTRDRGRKLVATTKISPLRP